MMTTNPAKDITHLATALKAPRIRDHATRLADQARTDGWTYEEYLAAVLDREVSARDASGADMRIGTPGSPPARASRTSTLTTNQLSAGT